MRPSNIVRGNARLSVRHLRVNQQMNLTIFIPMIRRLILPYGRVPQLSLTRPLFFRVQWSFHSSSVLLNGPYIFPRSLLFVHSVGFRGNFGYRNRIYHLLGGRLPLPHRDVLLNNGSPFRLLLLRALPILRMRKDMPYTLFTILMN